MSESGQVTGPDRAERAGRLLVVLQFGLLAVMAWRAWMSAHAFHPGTVCLLAVAGALAAWSLSANRPGNFNIRPTLRPGATLITAGPYRWIRHPMYTSVLTAAAAAAAASRGTFDAVLWLALLAVLWAKSGIEETALLARFPDYRDYMTRTRRLLPWPV
jgi:protein-S-isoprenylcysteine O-methyltransferase Ste14